MLHALNELCIAATKGTKQTGEALEYYLPQLLRLKPKCRNYISSK
jgi:hypothetical protein